MAPHLTKKNTKEKESWRTKADNFLHKNGQELSPGVDSYALGWLPQGHGVSFLRDVSVVVYLKKLIV